MEHLGGFRKYPSLRDGNLKTSSQWLKGRRMDDNIADLWRVHDKLYDLSDFAGKHPGGREWLELTQGTDITEAFESSHLSESVRKILDKYYIKPASSERISPYTFHPNGFYSTLKRRVDKHLSEIPAEKLTAAKCKVAKVHNLLLLSYATLFILTGFTNSLWLAALAGMVLFMNINCSHNYFHQKNSWRMYVWDLGLLSSHEWRVSHAISHHGYTNSVMDIEISGLEPLIDFKVYARKRKIQAYFSAVVIFATSQFAFFVQVVNRVLTVLLGQQKLRPENLLPLVQLGLLALFSERPAVLWLVMQTTSSYLFVVIGVATGHHHPDLFHPGDDQFQYGLDWGLAQLDAVHDRTDINGILLAELTSFGNHILHHLFPTLDHGLLDLIRPVFQQTCKDFGLPEAVYQSPCLFSQWDMFVGTFQQLIRNKPRSISKTNFRKKYD